MTMTIRVRVKVRECGRKIRNRMPKSDDKTESNGIELAKREEGGRGKKKIEEDKEEERRGGEIRRGRGAST